VNPHGSRDVWCLERPKHLLQQKVKPLQKGYSTMASEKQRRKERAVDRKLKRPATSKIPRDGDRRHRGVDMGRQAQKRKEAERNWTIDSDSEGFLGSREEDTNL
jgi:hypothetical protein